MRLAALLPEHDVSTDRDWVRRRLASLAAEVTQAGPIAVGPGAYALGCGWLALGDIDRARAELDRAWAAGQRSAEVALALGEAWERAWERQKDEATRESADARDHADEQLSRGRAAEWLKRARGTTRIDAALLEAKIDYVEDRTDQARREAEVAFTRDPQLFEARLLDGRASSKLGHKLADRGQLAAARAEYARAETVLGDAAQIARSDPETQFQLCRLYDRILELPPIEGAQPRDEVAVVACRRAVHVDPSSDSAQGKLAIALNRVAELDLAAGRDAAALLVESRAAAERAVALQPRFINHYRVLANSLRLVRDYAGARAVIARGLAADPDPKSRQKLLVTDAQIEIARGRELLAHHADAGGAPVAALASLDRARALADDFRVRQTTAAALVLAVAAAEGDRGALIKEARRAIADTLALTHEETPALRALSAELDGLTRAARQ